MKLLRALVGQKILTISRRCPNRILAVEGDKVIVATSRSPSGQPIPIEWVQTAMDTLARDEEITIDVETVGCRSAFIGAALATLPGVAILATSPPRKPLRAAIANNVSIA